MGVLTLGALCQKEYSPIFYAEKVLFFLKYLLIPERITGEKSEDPRYVAGRPGCDIAPLANDWCCLF